MGAQWRSRRKRPPVCRDGEIGNCVEHNDCTNLALCYNSPLIRIRRFAMVDGSMFYRRAVLKPTLAFLAIQANIAVGPILAPLR